MHQVAYLRASGPGASGHLDDGLLAARALGSRSDTAARRLSGSPARSGPGAPATTIVTSPRTPSAAQATSSASGPRRTSSCVLVSSRHTAAARSSPNASASAASAAPVRCGASKNTIVALAGQSARRRARSPALRGRNPSKQNRSTGSPETASAVSTAEGPARRSPARPPPPRPPPAGSPGRRRWASRRRSPAAPGRRPAAPRAGPASGPTRCPRSRRPPGPLTVTPRSVVSRLSRRVSSAATTSAVASSSASRGVRPRPGRWGSRRARARRAAKSRTDHVRDVQLPIVTTPATPETSVRGRSGRAPPRAGPPSARRAPRGGPARGPGRGLVGQHRRRPVRASSGCGTLRTPREFEFDETYYAKDAWSLLHFGYVREYVGKANERILDGTVTACGRTPRR